MVVWVPVRLAAQKSVVAVVIHRVAACVLVVVLRVAKTNVEKGVWGLVQTAVKMDAGIHVLILVGMHVKGVPILVRQLRE